jgi:hypothetical protein
MYFFFLQLVEVDGEQYVIMTGNDKVFLLVNLTIAFCFY